MSNPTPVSKPGTLVARMAASVIFVLVCLFFLNIGLSMINEASDVEFYLGFGLVLAPLGALAYAGLRIFNYVVATSTTSTKEN